MVHHSAWTVDKHTKDKGNMIEPGKNENRELNSESIHSELEPDQAFISNDYETGVLCSGIEDYMEYELLNSDASTYDEGSISSSNDEDEIEGIVVLDEREVDTDNGKKSQFLVECWIDKKHFELFSELMRMS
ncbi:uncharacterized protein KD926_003770 [Aspergillus affinis]|uniref:uncharacterized protein n=1 Tax=Aspergillus affinis TaxID=1070780 RepID=UPI0022FF263F|nr:uncharacterized protein KD926_003770 [Aspergillus affinis]KAI9035297.1 hypothetical protein KD926_003770 [Aspergillus affinis]